MEDLEALADRLTRANQALAPPATESCLHPLHTVYGGAHLFREDVAARLGRSALAAMDEHGLDAATLASLLAIDLGLAGDVLGRVRRKLADDPVEDYRIDFEDGYGVRPDEEEDSHATAAARAVARGVAAGTLPVSIGLRIKPLGEATRRRAERTLRLFLGALLPGGAIPPRLVVTLPKVTIPEQPAYLAGLLTDAEAAHGLARGTLKMELMVETPESLVRADGGGALRGLVDAGGGRVLAAHFGAYDYTAALGVAAAAQSLRHPACDWARSAMQLQLAGTGVRLVDGATTTLPVPPHRGDALSAKQRVENRDAVHRGWALHAGDVRHAMEAGFYQGWDLHPAQLVSRHAAVHAFFRSAAAAAGVRLRHFVGRAAQATRVGAAFDDAATGLGLLNFFRHALSCGALDATEVEACTGLPAGALVARTFAEIAPP